MRAKEELPECPVATAVSLIGGKWKLLILRNLKERPWRFNELQRSIDGISQKVLTDSLRQMMSDGLAYRHDYHEQPPRVEYGLTELGTKMLPIVNSLADFGKEFSVGRVCFNWETTSWKAQKYYLPCYADDYVLLTPKAMLTRDDTFINRIDMIRNLQEIAPAISDDALRFELEIYFREVLYKKKKELSQTEKNDIATRLIKQHPELIDYYMKYKEDNEAEATSISKEKVEEVETLFNDQISQLVSLLNEKTEFYHRIPDAHDEAKLRVGYLKHVIEEQDGYKLFYAKGKPIKREADLQVIYRLVWYGSDLDVNREVNNGRGPVDYKISYGKKNSTLVEFKLASNSKLKQNLAKQVEVYKAASETERAIKVIMFFSEKEYEKICAILNELELVSCEDIILIDARDDNKESASNVKL